MYLDLEHLNFVRIFFDTPTFDRVTMDRSVKFVDALHCWVHRCRLLLLSRLGTGDPGLAMVSGGVPLLRGVLGDSDIQHDAWQVLLGTAFSHNWGR